MLLAYFSARTDMLIKDSETYYQHQCLRDQLQALVDRNTPPRYRHLLISFPGPDANDTSDSPCWAGSYVPGSLMDVSHLVLLSPAEARCAPIFVFHMGAANQEESGVRFTKKPLCKLGTAVTHIPNDANEGEQRAPIFLMERDARYQILIPTDPSEAATTIASIISHSCIHSYLSHHVGLSQDTSFASILGLCAPCSRFADLSEDHQGRLQALRHSLPPLHVSEITDDDAAHDDEALDILGSGDKRAAASDSDDDDAPSSPEKLPNQQHTPPRHAARLLQFPTTASLASQTSQLSIQDTSDSAISNVSNIDL